MTKTGAFLAAAASFLVRQVHADAATSKFNIMIPKELNKLQGYDHRDAMFGIPPYGASIQQPVIYAHSTFCDTNNNDVDMSDWRPPFILMVDRGGCSFVQKIRNAQRAGASGVIVADDICICGRPGCPDAPGYDEEKDEAYFCETQEPIMADDGSGADISIPSFLLFQEDSEPIKAALIKGEHVRGQMSFSIPAPDSRVEYQLWTSPADGLVRELQEDFFSAVMALKEHASFTPHMYIYDGVYAGCHGDNGDDLCLDLCSNGGRYCSVDLDIHSGATGQEVVAEALRRICIWNLYGVDGIGMPWWDYVREFTERCDSGTFDMDGKVFSSQDCIGQAMAAAGVDKVQVDKCIQESGGTEDDVENTLLKKELEDQESAGVTIVPSLFVNQAVIRGFLNFETTFKAICAGFATGTEPPICLECSSCPNERACVINQGCAITSGLFLTPNGNVASGAFVGAMAMLLLTFSVIGYIQYRRQQSNMRSQIQSVVAEYMPINTQNPEADTSMALPGNDGDGNGGMSPTIS